MTNWTDSISKYSEILQSKIRPLSEEYDKLTTQEEKEQWMKKHKEIMRLDIERMEAKYRK